MILIRVTFYGEEGHFLRQEIEGSPWLEEGIGLDTINLFLNAGANTFRAIWGYRPHRNVIERIEPELEVREKVDKPQTSL